jgi:Mg2+/citrate symporter
MWLTGPLATRIPVERRPVALRVIKAFHTAVFFSVAGAIAMVVWDGLRQRPRRLTAGAVGVAVVESVVFASNNLVCPLTPLAEDLGAASGSVTDIYLPDSVSRRIPIVSVIALALGIALNLRARRLRGELIRAR